MKCAACGYDDTKCRCPVCQGEGIINVGGSYPCDDHWVSCTRCGGEKTVPDAKEEPFLPVTITFPVVMHSNKSASYARTMPTNNLYACPKCRTVRLGD